jgi:pyroglutamyl-peptidase
MGRDAKTILLTGFGPFPGVTENASASLVQRLAQTAERRFPARRVTAAVLATEWDRAPKQLAALYARFEPGLVIHFGVSEKARGFVIETIAANACRPAADAAGMLPRATCLSDRAPTAFDVTLPVRRIHKRLAALGLPVELSQDAGAYLCNAVLFQSLERGSGWQRGSSGTGPVRAGFIHIPSRISARTALDWDAAEAGALEILRVCLDLPDRRR